jgi:hypothetical protein
MVDLLPVLVDRVACGHEQSPAIQQESFYPYFLPFESWTVSMGNFRWRKDCLKKRAGGVFWRSLDLERTILVQAVRDLQLQNAVSQDIAQAVQKAMQGFLAVVPRPLKGFELDHLDEIEKLVREQEEREADQEKNKQHRATRPG